MTNGERPIKESSIVISQITKLVVIIGIFTIAGIFVFNKTKPIAAAPSNPTENVAPEIEIRLNDMQQRIDEVFLMIEKANENTGFSTVTPPPVASDENTNQPKQPKDVMLYDMPYIDIRNANVFHTSGNERENIISLMNEDYSGSVGKQEGNYVVYPLNGLAHTFRTSILPPSVGVISYRIYGDGNLLYTSVPIGPSTPKIPVEFPIIDVVQLKIELDVSQTNGLATVPGMQNALIVTTDY